MASDFGDAAKRVSQLRDRLEDGHERATRESMSDLKNEVRTQLSSNRSVARGVLLRDIRDGDSAGYPQFVARAVSVPGWARYLEHGTGFRARRDTLPNHDSYKAPDGLPPLNPILSWVIAKNITSEEYDSRYALAQAIRETIGEQGTFPHPFLRPSWFGGQGYRNVITANKRAMRRAVRRF